MDKKAELKAKARKCCQAGPVLTALEQLIEDAIASAPALIADIEALIAALTPVS